MVRDDIPGVRGAPGGSRGASGGARGCRGDKATPDVKMSDKTAK